LYAFFKKRGILERRSREMLNAINRKEPGEVDLADARSMIRQSIKYWIGLKCPIGKVEILRPTEYRILPRVWMGKSIGEYFAKPTYLESMPKLRDLRRASAPVGIPPLAGDNSPLAEDAYVRETKARRKLIVKKHNALSNKFAIWLEKKGHTVVTREKSRVDIDFWSDHDLCRAELKACTDLGTRQSIREALGQLLEYNCYGYRASAERWLIILDTVPSEEDTAWVKGLREEFELPLWLGWYANRRFIIPGF
jgi:hypothetical protein